jgi:hypothetical protein
MDGSRAGAGRADWIGARARACLSRRNWFLFARGFAVLPFCPFSAVLPHLGYFVFLPEAETKLPNSHLIAVRQFLANTRVQYASVVLVRDLEFAAIIMGLFGSVFFSDQLFWKSGCEKNLAVERI